jgi:hypothetical protein
MTALRTSYCGRFALAKCQRRPLDPSAYADGTDFSATLSGYSRRVPGFVRENLAEVRGQLWDSHGRLTDVRANRATACRERNS